MAISARYCSLVDAISWHSCIILNARFSATDASSCGEAVLPGERGCRHMREHGRGKSEHKLTQFT